MNQRSFRGKSTVILNSLWRHFRTCRRRLSPALILLGAILLAYVGVQYGRMYKEQHDLAERWAQQEKAGQHAASEQSIDDDLIRLYVPRIDLSSFVVEGTSYRDLLLGPGHVPHTPFPGADGNSVITGHRDTFFRHINELEKGDTVLVQRAGKTYKYEVMNKEIVDPTDVSVLDPTPDTRLTLITCYPTYFIGPAPKRLVVSSRYVGEENGQDGTEVQTPAANTHGQGGAN